MKDWSKYGDRYIGRWPWEGLGTTDVAWTDLGADWTMTAIVPIWPFIPGEVTVTRRGVVYKFVTWPWDTPRTISLKITNALLWNRLY